MDHVESGRVKRDDIITHHLSPRKCFEDYEVFDKKQDGCVKVVVVPWKASGI
ncbi:hypothetical protein [Chryseobacterium salviniae]|uniref:Uncharacterized protein n=1 Tax=Chryseobacterium salviniae TaxID=3101750 RepID=A0ABU6HV63_9FLAO|nr:hypothetical protein [Chryseobacterium sp. T9W2-O]MEC3876342.1 hypothetical protein [Chryseobacterium sp. T9W2-O]